MKMEWLVPDSTAIGSQLSAETEDLWAIFDVFGQFGPLLLSESNFVFWKHPLEP